MLRRTTIPALVALVALVALPACRKPDGAAADAGPTVASAATASASAPSAAVPPRGAADAGEERGEHGAPPIDVRPVPPPFVQGARARLVRLEEDPALAANAAVVRAHFGERQPVAFALQTVALTESGTRALVVSDASRPVGESKPLLLVVDGPTHALRWSKHGPVGGILPPFGALALAAGPRGRVVLGICDPPTKRVALRLWDDEGSSFADFDAMDVEDCTTLSTLYWPGSGWVLVATRPGETRGQLVGEQGQLRWGRGAQVGARSRTGAAAALGHDGTTFVLVQPGPASGSPDEVEHAHLFRYDDKAAPVGVPVRLGPVPSSASSLAPLPLERARPGVFRVTLGARPIEVGPDGRL